MSEDPRLVIVTSIQHLSGLAEKSFCFREDIDDFQLRLLSPFRSGKGFLFRGLNTTQSIAEIAARLFQADDDVAGNHSVRRPFIEAGGRPESAPQLRAGAAHAENDFPQWMLFLRIGRDPSGSLNILVKLHGKIHAFLHQRMAPFLEWVIAFPFFRFEIDNGLFGDGVHFFDPLPPFILLLRREFRLLLAAFPYQARAFLGVNPVKVLDVAFTPFEPGGYTIQQQLHPRILRIRLGLRL